MSAFESPSSWRHWYKGLVSFESSCPKKIAARRNECCNGLLFPPEQFPSYRTFFIVQDLFSIFLLPSLGTLEHNEIASSWRFSRLEPSQRVCAH